MYEQVPEVDLYYVDEYKAKYTALNVNHGVSGDMLEKLHNAKTWTQQSQVIHEIKDNLNALQNLIYNMTNKDIKLGLVVSLFKHEEIKI